jgi:hypothetical protein
VKYDAGRNEKLFNDGLNKGRRDNSLGTVYQLARDAGVSLKGDGWKADWEVYRYEGRDGGRSEKTGQRELLKNEEADNQDSRKEFSESSPFPASSGGSYTHARLINRKNSNNRARKNINFSPNDQNYEDDGSMNPKENPDLQVPPAYKAYAWPRFLQQCIDCGERDSQRDVLWLSCLSILGATTSPLLRFNYAHKLFYPNLQLFVVAPAAAGKGVMSWAYQLGVPLQLRYRREFKRLTEEYKLKYSEWNTLGKQRGKVPEPEKPPLRLFYISGNNTGTGVLENIADAHGVGCIFSSEADEIVYAIGGDYGHWSDVLRKVFDHDPLTYNRRINKEYREVQTSWVSVVLSGTPGQVEPLIPTPENGLFSRQVFYYMQAVCTWRSQFDEDEDNYNEKFLRWGFRWDKVMEMIRPAASEVFFYLKKDQQAAFDKQLAAIFVHANMTYGSNGRSTVARIAINLLRLMSMVAWIRALDEWLMAEEDDTEHAEISVTKRLLSCPGIEPARGMAAENIQDGVVSRFRLTINDADFEAMLDMTDKIYRHALYIMTMLPRQEERARSLSPKEKFLNDLPISFARKDATELAKNYGLNDKQVDRLIEQMLETGELLRTSFGYFAFNPQYYN